ncbi:branched-chain amino acid ABC transporter permease, partial [Desulfovibrio sp. OttesenSCG-928-A18]|nr:branched-chain amino acid ABC transporter permease [Desulfovibrio sp. OttesenSCG-928-A18]
HSRFGRALNYIKHDDLAAAGCGINVTRYKLLAFTLGAFWAGMTGTLFAANIRTIEPTSFSFYESVILFAIVILGGSGSIAGVILGSFLLIGLQDVFRGFESARMLVFGAAMMLMMIFRPQGLLPPRVRRYEASGLVGRYPGGVRKQEAAAGPPPDPDRAPQGGAEEGA